MIESAYETLKVKRDATPEEVRNAYVRQVRRYPPEHFPEKFAAIQNAYHWLCLDDAFVDDFVCATLIKHTPMEVAGALWGDWQVLNINDSVDFRGLGTLLVFAERRKALDALLAQATEEPIEWRGPVPKYGNSSDKCR